MLLDQSPCMYTAQVDEWVVTRISTFRCKKADRNTGSSCYDMYVDNELIIDVHFLAVTLVIMLSVERRFQTSD